MKELLRLCSLVSPEKLECKCIFHSEERYPVGSSNRFCSVNSTETGVVDFESVFVGTVQVSVKKFINNKNSWKKQYYREPLTRLLRAGNNTAKNNDEWIYLSTSDSVDCCVIQ